MNLIRRLRLRYGLAGAVKEAFDTLPSAVCYFNRVGAIKLCNTAMYARYRMLTQSELQSLPDLRAALEACDGTTGVIRDGNVFVFPDGAAMQYSEKEITTAEGRTYTECIFSNVTKLYSRRRELQHQSTAMKKMYGDLRTLSDQLLEITREQEILNMKSRLHDQMNVGITAIRQVLRQNTTSEENAAAIARFRRAIQILQEESVCPQDDLNEFIRDAKVAGVEVCINGSLPEEKETLREAIDIMREACINAARHADAGKLMIDAETTADMLTLRMTSDGKAPEQEIVPRGGLRDIDNRLRKAGGSMEIRSLPGVELTVKIPVRGQERKERAQR